MSKSKPIYLDYASTTPVDERVAEKMLEQTNSLESFVEDLRGSGYRHVVLLGIGGSSVGEQVLAQAYSTLFEKQFGEVLQTMDFIALDSTVPGSVLEVTEKIDPAHTIFLISSKSGSTFETNVLYDYFSGLVENIVGSDRVGQHFAAITDSGTSLDKLSRRVGFREVFLNPLDIGGRYSVLSYFGLVPSALNGFDFKELLGRAEFMRSMCRRSVYQDENPGLWLGIVMATVARQGRDKLTIITSPSVDKFGLWVEHLVAESTGKEGGGIIPIVGEPLVSADIYADDRLFVYLRLDGDSNLEVDQAVDRIEEIGHPVVRFRMRDIYDLGAEFYRWEFATAVAGAVFGINPFDQPNVQESKGITSSILERYQTSGELPERQYGLSISELLDRANPPNYFAILAYMRQMPEVDCAIKAIREKVLGRYGIATTASYGPGYLHSAGELHKGGPDSGFSAREVHQSCR